MDETVKVGVSLLAAIIGVAILSVIFSKNAATGSVITAAGNAFGGLLKIATSPITGAPAAATAGGGGTGGMTQQSGITTPLSGVNIPGLITSATGLVGGVNSLIGSSNSTGGLTGVPGGPGIYPN